ncbi:MAG: signal transduction histidine kinase [Sulfurimonas sp.]|jgi:signal transduction histidine kinase
MNIIKKLILHIEKYNLYHIIIFFTIAFLLIFFSSFYLIRKDLIKTEKQYHELLLSDVERTISSWLVKKTHELEFNTKYLDNISLDDPKEIFSFMKVFSSTKYFDAIQLVLPESYFYFNTRQVHNFKINKVYIQPEFGFNVIDRDWYKNTKTSLSTTITIVKTHANFHRKALLISTPVFGRKKEFKGVMCGVLKVNSLFKKIEELKFPKNYYYFIMSSEGKIITKLNKKTLINSIEKTSKKFISKNIKTFKIKLTDNVIILNKLKDYDWYIGVGTTNKKILEKISYQIVQYGAILFSCFIIFFVVINSAYYFLRKNLVKKQKEYEYLLAHRSRISEIGHLVSSINHQLKQPLNSTALIVSNTLNMSNQDTLDKKTLNHNLELCNKTIYIMNKTIGIFRNFYRCNEDISCFDLKECVDAVLHINHTDLSRSNISIEVINNIPKDCHIESIDNYVQQILLVLIQNAKEAILSTKDIKKTNVHTILLNISNSDDTIYIDVEDNGVGVSKEIEKTLFSELKSSKKYEGSGLGLYFAKQLAQEKLKGDIVLKSNSLPTIFRLTFPRSINTKV